MRLVGLPVLGLPSSAILASLAAGESLKKLDTSLTIITNNDLQGMPNPNAPMN